MGKRTASIEGWSVTLRVRVQKKKRVVKGRTRGRYEGNTAHVIVLAPDGTRREYYLGSGGRHKKNAGVSDPPGEEKPAGGRLELRSSTGGRTGGKKALSRDNDTRDPADNRTGSLFSEGRTHVQAVYGYKRRQSLGSWNGCSVNDVKGVPNR